MVFLFLLLVFIAASVPLYLVLRRAASRGALWRAAILIGVAVGAARALLASVGWYLVEHSGGPLQVPAYALSMLAWPEAALLPSARTAPAPATFYVVLTLAVLVSTFAGVVLIAVAVRTDRSR